MTPEEAKQVIQAMTGTPQLVAKLLYGSGVRLLKLYASGCMTWTSA